MENGYFVISHKDWEELGVKEYAFVCSRIRLALPQLNAPDNFSNFSNACHTNRGSTRPIIHGNPVRKTPNYVCIDMWAASLGLITTLQFPKIQGEVANTRAYLFEDAVQDLIDNTKWGQSEIRSQRQKHLKLYGKQLTDIDAIGARGKDLLIVSCKSIPYSMEYDQGVYRTIRNAENTAIKAVFHWKEIVNKLNANRIGDNYDFSGFDRIIGVVCTPFVVYTSAADALSATTGSLRWVCSPDELEQFLRTDT
jgi:hypothetical protein